METTTLAPTTLDAVVTYYDDATGERTSLTGVELRTWVARTANLLRQGCGLDLGARATVLLPPHWQTAVVLLGCWSAGVAVEFRGELTAGLARLTPALEPDAVFTAPHRVDNWLDDIPPAPHRFVVGGQAEGYRPFLEEISRYEASELTVHHGATSPATVDGTSYREWASVAGEMAAALDLRPGHRVLVDAAEHEHPLKWLLTPLSVGASVVICANLDPTRLPDRIATEAVTRRL